MTVECFVERSHPGEKVLSLGVRRVILALMLSPRPND